MGGRWLSMGGRVPPPSYNLRTDLGSIPPWLLGASLDKMLYDDNLCVVASNKQQIQRIRFQRNPQKYWISWNYQAGADSWNHEAVSAIKSVQIFQQLASKPVRQQKL